jgi:hypothetical protein
MLNSVKHLFNAMISSRIDTSLSLRMTKKNSPLSAAGEERVTERSDDRVSQLCAFVKSLLSQNPTSFILKKLSLSHNYFNNISNKDCQKSGLLSRLLKTLSF